METAKNQLTKPDGKKQTFSSWLASPKIKDTITSTLGSEKAMTRFTSSILSAVSINPDLQKCEFPTVLSAGLLANALELSLSPTLGFAYIVPFKDNKNNRTVATFILSYRGYLQLAIRSGYYRKINVLEIKEGELVKYNPLEEDIKVKLIEDEEERQKAKTVGYYAMFEQINGFKKVIYWSKSKMLNHADRYSKAFSLNATKGKYPKVSYADYEEGNYPEKDEWLYSSYWYKEFDMMARKTMIRHLLSHWGIMSIEMQKAYDEDTANMERMGDAIDVNFTLGTEEPDVFGEEEATEEVEPVATKTVKRKKKTEPENVVDVEDCDIFGDE